MSAKAGAEGVGGGDRGDKFGTRLLSTSTLGAGSSPLREPLPPHLVPPPGPVVGGEKKSVSPWLAP